jgi:lysophospholipase
MFGSKAKPKAAPEVETPETPADLVMLPENPAPEGARAIWYEIRGGIRVRMMFAPEPKGGQRTRGTVFVCPGRTEYIEKYFEVARELQAKGFAVAVFDWPGQGLSSRMLKDRSLGHIRHFGQFVEAFRRGVETLGGKAPKPHMVLAHSMGGAIALEALRTGRVTVKAAAFCAPMWGLRAAFYQRWFARLMRLFGQGGRPVGRPGPPEMFSTNPLTHDERRWELNRTLLEAQPDLALGEPTIGWVVEALNVTREFHDNGSLEPLRALPVLACIAQEEALVNRSLQQRLAKRFKNGRMVLVKGARHEILMETDDLRAEFWEEFDKLCKRADI